MSSQDIAIADNSKLAKPRTAPPSRVSPKIKQAIEHMVADGLPWNDAAVKVGITTRTMRLALDRPHVLAYLRQCKQVLREAASAANITRLTQIRDAADNMPAVNAIKVLEQIGDEQPGQRNAGHSTGLTIRLVQINASAAHDNARQHVIEGESQLLAEGRGEKPASDVDS
jgi:hypothetical protein